VKVLVVKSNWSRVMMIWINMSGSFSKYSSTACNNYKYSFPIYNAGGSSLNSENGGKLYYCSPTLLSSSTLPPSAPTVTQYCASNGFAAGYCYGTSSNDTTRSNNNSTFTLTYVPPPTPAPSCGTSSTNSNCICPVGQTKQYSCSS